jgi:hypothetical protein
MAGAHRTVNARSFLFYLVAIAVSLSGFPMSKANAASFKFTKVVDNYTKIPGTNDYFGFNGSDVPAICGDVVVFDAGDCSVWAGLVGNTTLTKIFDTATKVPGSQDTFFQYYGNTLQVFNNTIVFVGQTGSTYFGLGGVGIYSVPATGGAISTLVDVNTFLPGSTTQKFSGFTFDFKAKYGLVVFQSAQQVYSVPVNGGPVTAIAGSQDSGYSQYCCIFGSPDCNATTVVLLDSNVYGVHSVETVDKSGNPNSFSVVADGSTQAPGLPANYSFDGYTFDAPLFDRDVVIFHSAINNINPPMQWDVYDGLYAAGGGLGLRTLVDDHTPVPGGQGNFSRNGFPHSAANGTVVFIGQDAGGNNGLYSVSEKGGAITKIIAKGDPIGNSGFTAGNGFQLGPGAMSGKRLVFRVEYASYGIGMYCVDQLPVVSPSSLLLLE